MSKITFMQKNIIEFWHVPPPFKYVYGCLCDSIQPNIHTSTYLYSIYMDPLNQVCIHVCICIDIILCIILCIGVWV